jgi:ferredoxin
MAVRVELDLGLCMGVGECVFRAPDVFVWNDSGSQSQLRVDVVDTAHLEEAVRRAADCCPNFAIRVTDVA